MKSVLLALVFAAFAVVGGDAAAQLPDPVSTATSAVQDTASAVQSTASSASSGDPVSNVTNTVSGTVDAAGSLITGGSSGGGSGGSASGGGSGGGGGGGTGPVDSVVGSVSGTVDSTSDSVGSTVGSAGSTAGSTAGSGSGTTSASGSGTGATAGGAAGSAARVGIGPRTALDRLPSRFEALLERIAAGRNVGDNLRRLERALATASPEVRKRVLRAVRAEIKRLRKDGLTRSERRRVERLHRVIAVIKDRNPGTTSAPSTPLASAKSSSPAAWGTAGATATGTSASSGVAGADTRAGSARKPDAASPSRTTEGGRGMFAGDGILGVPSGGSALAIGIYVALGILLLVSLVSFALAATPLRSVPAGRLREFVQWSRPDLVTTGLATATGLALLLFYGALF